MMKKISMTILASLAVISLSAEKTPGFSKADEQDQAYMISYIGANPIQGATGIDRLTKADDISDKSH